MLKHMSTFPVRRPLANDENVVVPSPYFLYSGLWTVVRIDYWIRTPRTSLIFFLRTITMEHAENDVSTWEYK